MHAGDCRVLPDPSVDIEEAMSYWIGRWTDPTTNRSCLTWVGATSESYARSICDALNVQFVGPIAECEWQSDECNVIATWDIDWNRVEEAME